VAVHYASKVWADEENALKNKEEEGINWLPKN